jgi:hypothetical protein
MGFPFPAKMLPLVNYINTPTEKGSKTICQGLEKEETGGVQGGNLLTPKKLIGSTWVEFSGG